MDESMREGGNTHRSCDSVPQRPTAARTRWWVGAPTNQEHSGADRDRTGDLRLAKPALSQLSYSPEAITP